MPAVAPAESPFDRRRHPAALAFVPWAAPDGWRHRSYRWPAAAGSRPRGSLLFQTGRADFIEKYLETCDHFHRGGWLVEGFDWRGQGGSGRLAPGIGADDRASFVPLIDDLVAYVAGWRTRTPPPHVAVAHSLGGYVLLMMLARGAAAPLERVTTPVQLLVPGLDPLVRPAAADRIAARLRDATLRRFPTARHELLREADGDRDVALAAIDGFLDTRAPTR